MKHFETLAIRGDLHIQVHNQNGELVSDTYERNLVVDVGKTSICRLLGGSGTGRQVTTFGVGTSLVPAAAGDTGLTGPFTKAVGTITYPSATQVRFTTVLEYAEANGMNIGEFGLYSQNGTLFARLVRISALAKDNTIRITVEWTINF